MNNRILCFITLCLVSFTAYAQSLRISTELTSGEASAKVVTIGNEFHAVEGGRVTYAFNFSQPSTDVITSATLNYTYDGKSESKTLIPVDGKLTLESIAYDNLMPAVTSKTFSCSLSYVCQREEKDTTISVTAAGTPFKIYERPQATVQVPSNLICYERANTVFSASATGGGSWSYRWEPSSGSVSTSSSYICTEINNSTSKKTIKVKLSMTNYAPDGTTVWAKLDNYEYNIEIYPKAVVNVSPAVNYSFSPETRFQDQPWTLSVSSSGGYDTGWKFVWTDEKGSVLGTGKSCTISSERSKQDINKQITLTVSNTGIKSDGTSEQWLKDTKYTWYVKFLPCPVFELTNASGTTDMLYGDDITIGFKVTDDDGRSLLDDPEYNWTYTWSYDGWQSSGRNFTVRADNNTNNNGVRKVLTLSISGKSASMKQAYTATREEIIYMWPTPSAQMHESVPSYFDACGGQSRNMLVRSEGGVKNGWRYTWHKNGVIVYQSSENDFVARMENENESNTQTVNYRVSVENYCMGTKRYSKVFNYDVVVYPRPRYSDHITLYDVTRGGDADNGIREGNLLRVQLDECYGGYYRYSPDDRWTFNITRDGVNVSNSRVCEKRLETSTKQSKTIWKNDYTVHATNTYSNGDIWANVVPEAKTLKIYCRPLTPSSLTVKGYGKSATYIAMFDVNDDVLINNDYYLVFGYTDANGIDHHLVENKQSVGNLRFGTFTTSEFNNKKNIFWVYSLWKYDDGPYITSGRRYLYDVDKEWDGSAYTPAEISSRVLEGDVNGIAEIISDENLNTDEYVYNVMGEKVDRKSMKRGIYIVNGKKILNK